MEIKKYLSLFVILGIISIIQLAGSFLTLEAVISWYPDVAKPSFNPPNWLFAPVWSFLYLMIAVSGWLVWQKRKENKKAVDSAMTVYAVQLFLNTAWSYIFFGSKNFGLAFFEIIILLAAIIWNIAVFYRISKNAAYVLVPYALWVSFAAVLNFAVWQLNP